MKSLKPRLLTAAIGVPAVILIIVISELWSPFLRIMLGIVSGIMIGEYMYGNKLLKRFELSIPCMVFSCACSLLIGSVYVYLLLYVFLAVVFFVSIVRHKVIDFSQLCYSVVGNLLISFGMSAVAVACSNEFSLTFCFMLVFLLPWMADAGGFFIGASLGKNKLCPDISPKKTVEGAIGGVVFCIISALLLGLVFQLWVIPGVSVNFISLIILGALDAVLSIVGDLSFSLIKRNLNIKDYGNMFPGHGGMLDRCDSIIFTAPLVVLIGQFLPFLTMK